MPFHFADHFHSSPMTPAEEKPDFFPTVDDNQESAIDSVDAVNEDEFDHHEPRPRQDSFHQSSDNLIVGL
ncbi:hypothetical protein CAAN1_13S01860 [[Candida] anglica]|uniref:Uncharacterized protein n=1 Tax=[Candida] anglica TaxID=148631 RepID=A0ABP0EG46_9ASCO